MAEEDIYRRTMPNSLEAEQAVIASMLTDAEAIETAIEKLDAGDFYYAEYRFIFDAIKKLYEDGKKVDQNDPFYKCLVKYTSDYTVETSKVRSSFAEKYVIDVTSDGTVKRTQAPEKDY